MGNKTSARASSDSEEGALANQDVQKTDDVAVADPIVEKTIDVPKDDPVVQRTTDVAKVDLVVQKNSHVETDNQVVQKNSDVDKEGAMRVTQTPKTIAADAGSGTSPLRQKAKPKIDRIIEPPSFNVGDTVYYLDGQKATVVGIDEDGDINVKKQDGSTGNWYLNRCSKEDPSSQAFRQPLSVPLQHIQECEANVMITQSPLDDLEQDAKNMITQLATTLTTTTTTNNHCISSPERSPKTSADVDESPTPRGVLNLEGLPDVSADLADEEAGIGDTVYYIDGQEATVIGRDVDGDVKVRKADGSTSCWYASKCTRAIRKVAEGEAVRYSCGEVAIVEGFDEDGDVKVRKKDGKQSIWYRRNTSGLDVPVSKRISRQNSGDNLLLLGGSAENLNLLGA